MELVQSTDIKIEIDVAGDPWVTQEYGSTPADSADSFSQTNGGHGNCAATGKDTGQATVQEWEDPVQPSQVKLEPNTLVHASISIVGSSSGCVHKGAKATGEPGVQRQPLTSPVCGAFHQMEPYVKTESSEGCEPYVYHMDCDGKNKHSVSGDISLGEQKPYAEKCVDVEEGGMSFVCEIYEACFQSQRQLHKHMSAHSQPVQNPQVKLETGCEVKPSVQFLPGTISEPEVNPCVPAVTKSIACVSGCMKKGVKLELCTRSWLFQHPPDKLEPEDKVEPGVQLGQWSSSNSTFVDSTVGCMYYGVKLEPDIKDKHCVKLEPGTSSDFGVKLEPEIYLKATSGIKTEHQHLENGLGCVDCVHNGDVNMHKCQSDVKPDAVILCDSNVENLDAANCNVHRSGAGFVSVPLYECDKPAADLFLAPHSVLTTAAHSDLMTAAHSDLMTAAHSDLTTAAHSDLTTAAHSDLTTAAHSDLMTAAHSDLTTAAHSNLMRHSDLKPSKCKECDASFTNASKMKIHMFTHTGQKPHKCTVCGACFSQAGILTRHMFTHTGQKPHKCTVCGACFSRAYSLKRHMFTHTRQKPQCTVCGACFSHPGSLKKHMCTHTDQKPHKCTVCGASFSQAGNLKIHMFIHTGQKSHKCKECDAIFTYASSLKIHMFTHTGQKPYMCTVCGVFSDARSMKQHMFTHTGQKSHKCLVCDASFSQAGNLKIHMLTHTGQKPNTTVSVKDVVLVSPGPAN